MKRLFAFVLLAAAGSFSAAAQEESFDSFRRGILDRYADFRQEILEDYAAYLDGIWTEYKSFRGVDRQSLPKPDLQPVAQSSDEPPVGQPAQPAESKEDNVPEKKPEPVIPLAPPKPGQGTLRFDFYCIPVEVPQTGLEAMDFPSDISFADLWRLFAERQIASQVLPSLSECAERYRLNDWFIFELVRCYASNALQSASESVRVSMQHYLISNMGYEARIGVETSGRPMLMVAISQMVFARPFANVDGQKYFIFYADTLEAGKGDGSFYTCTLPANSKGNPLDLVIREEMKIPFSPQAYSFSHGQLTISGAVNANLRPMLFRYPQMPIGCYAMSQVSKSVHEEVSEQLKLQLAGMTQRQATDCLLQFVQEAFDYATDDNQHGFEKPYFFEELLFYPKCDCEDRSVFYSSLLWKILGLKNIVVSYPGHEAVAVCLDEAISGDFYSFDDKTFYVSDPTFIGSKTGMCMPTYKQTLPEVDFYYK